MGKIAYQYFFGKREEREKKNGSIMIFIVSLILMILAIILFNDNTVIGSVMGICGIIGLLLGGYSLNAGKLTFLAGGNYDKLVNQMITTLGSNAREYLGLDSSEIDEIEPISFEGYKYSGASRIRKDPEDGRWRSDLYERVTVFFTKNEIHLYKVFLNTLSEKITETTDVLFYDDVVSVSTKNEVEKIGNNNIEYISFNLVSKGGNNISIALDGNDTRQRSINAMRAMIKEKKTQ